MRRRGDPERLVQFGRRLAHLRESRGMTKVEMAQAISVNYRTYERWETGKIDPGISTLPLLASALGVKESDLLLPAPEEWRAVSR